jgi:hypothetical protein
MALSIIYYLVYKINSSPTLWIANVYETIDNKLIKYIKNFQSSQEVYYIVSKINNTCHYENIKQFTIFNLDDDCELICRSC